MGQGPDDAGVCGLNEKTTLLLYEQRIRNTNSVMFIGKCYFSRITKCREIAHPLICNGPSCFSCFLSFSHPTTSLGSFFSVFRLELVSILFFFDWIFKIFSLFLFLLVFFNLFFSFFFLSKNVHKI